MTVLVTLSSWLPNSNQCTSTWICKVLRKYRRKSPHHLATSCWVNRCKGSNRPIANRKEKSTKYTVVPLQGDNASMHEIQITWRTARPISSGRGYLASHVPCIWVFSLFFSLFSLLACFCFRYVVVAFSSLERILWEFSPALFFFFFFSWDKLAHTNSTLLHQDQSTVAQWAETAVAECSLTSCVWASFPIGSFTMPGQWHGQPTPTSLGPGCMRVSCNLPPVLLAE